MTDKNKIQIIGLLTICVAFLIAGSILMYDPTEEPSLLAQNINNPFNIVGVYVGFYLFKLGFGYASLFFPLILITIALQLISNFSLKVVRLLKFELVGLIFLSVIIGFFDNIKSINSSNQILEFDSSGLLGGLLLGLVFDWTGFIGTSIIIFFLSLIFIISFFEIDIFTHLKTAFNKFKKLDFKLNFDIKNILPERKERKESNPDSIIKDKEFINDLSDPKEEDKIETVDKSISEIKPKNNDKSVFEEDDKIIDDEVFEKLSIETAVEEKSAEIDDERKKSIIKKEWKFPSTDILQSQDESKEINEDDIRSRSELLKNSLSNFGVEGSSGSIKTGPIITLFEILPAEGVRVNKFVQLSDDIARVMEAQSVRVLAPIPGSNYVGVEIPNKNPQTIFLKNVINSEKYLKSKAKLKLAIGKGTLGDISILDLVDMPHLLIAGTTGSGKSVSLNTIIVSLLYQLKPEEVKFVIIDPKKVEMSLYRALESHYLLKFSGIDESIITKKDNAILALRSLEREMDSRYDLLAEAGKRNISEYNESMKKSKKDLMPYIILMIDELADLMMYSPRDVEAPIARLAQLARAVGIHLIVATQRPSVDVITGVIKANFPARIAFQVATKIDSRTILDENGADKLIGKGDMLYQKPGSPAPVRMHGAFITLKEIEDLVNHISSQPKPTEVIIETVKEESSLVNNGEEGINDDLLVKAIEIIVMSKQGSISLLQRRLSVGYSRAARLIDEMERLKIVGPFTGSKAREVLVDESYLETINEE